MSQQGAIRNKLKMRNSVQLKTKVPTLITSIVLVASLALAIIFYMLNAVQIEARSWYPPEYWTD